MLDKILDLLKLIFEKYLIPAIVTVPITIFLYVIVPETNLIQIKVGNIIFVVFIYTSIFSLIMLAIWVKKYITSEIEGRKQKVEREKLIEEQNERDKILKRNKEIEVFEELWDRVDALENDARRLIDELLKNKNNPIGMCIAYQEYELRFFVNCTPMKNGDKCKILMNGYYNDISMQYEPYEYAYDGYYKYKLKDDIYELLKMSKEKYGKISHFN